MFLKRKRLSIFRQPLPLINSESYALKNSAIKRLRSSFERPLWFLSLFFSSVKGPLFITFDLLQR